MNIFEINTEINKALEDNVDPETGEIKKDGIESVLALEMLKTDKLKAIGYVYKNCDNNIDLINKEMARLKELKIKEQNKQESIKNLLDAVMKSEGITSLGVGTLKVGYRKTPPKVVIDDQNKIPGQYLKLIQTVKVDKVKLKEDLKNGKVEGAHLETSKKVYVK